MTLSRPPVELDQRRHATQLQRARLAERAGGRCEVELDHSGNPLPAGRKGRRCNNKIGPGWVAGHFPVQWHHGGLTELNNLRVECKICAPKVGAIENRTAKKTNRMAGEKGSQRAKRENKSYRPIQSRGFQGHRKFNGEIVRKKK